MRPQLGEADGEALEDLAYQNQVDAARRKEEAAAATAAAPGKVLMGTRTETHTELVVQALHDLRRLVANFKFCNPLPMCLASTRPPTLVMLVDVPRFTPSSPATLQEEETFVGAEAVPDTIRKRAASPDVNTGPLSAEDKAILAFRHKYRSRAAELVLPFKEVRLPLAPRMTCIRGRSAMRDGRCSHCPCALT